MPMSLPTLCGILAIVCCSFMAFLTTQIQGVPVFQVAAIAFGVNFAIALTRTIYKRNFKILKQPSILWILGTLGVFGDALYFWAFDFSEPVHADLIYYTSPFLVVLFAGFLPKERFSRVPLLASLIGFSGVFLLISDGKGFGSISAGSWLGYLLAFLDAIFWAAYLLCSRFYSDRPVDLMGFFSGVAAILSLVFCIHQGGFVSMTLKEVSLSILIGLTTSGVALYLWDYAIKKGDIYTVSVSAYMTPFLSASILLMTGYAQPSKYFFIAFAVVLGATFIAEVNLPKLGVRIERFLTEKLGAQRLLVFRKRF